MVFNNGDFVKSTLDSILDNDYSNFDVIVNDDCSEDNSVEVIKKFFNFHASQTKNWKLNVNSENLGINASIKNILNSYENEWVKYIAGDDEFEHGSLEEYARLAHNNDPRNTIVLSDMKLIDEVSNHLGEKYSLSSLFYENNWLKTANLYVNSINAPTVLVGRATLINALNNTSARNAEDWPILRHCVLNNMSFKICQKQLVRYRISKTSLSSFYHYKSYFSISENKIQNQVEILLKENHLLTSNWMVRFGVFLQLKQLTSSSPLSFNFIRLLKLLNPQFFLFKLLEKTIINIR